MFDESMRSPRTFSALALAPLLVTGVFLASPAFAESPDRSDAIAHATRVTATKLRHRWDSARQKDKDASLASCLEPKVAEAMTLVSRVDHKRSELVDAKSATERQRIARTLEILDVRRGEVEAESSGCAPSMYQPTLGTKVTMSVLDSIAKFEPTTGSAGEPELLRALIMPVSVAR